MLKIYIYISFYNKLSKSIINRISYNVYKKTIESYQTISIWFNSNIRNVWFIYRTAGVEYLKNQTVWNTNRFTCTFKI